MRCCRLPAWVLLLALAAPAVTAQEFEPPAETGAEAETETAVDAPAPAPQDAAPAAAAPEAAREVGRGLASWYGPRFHGRRTASGERFDMHAFTAAHRTLPFGTVVRVRSLVNGRTVDVRITDRGPFLRRRVIDLSRAAAEALGLIESGSGTKPVVLLLPEVSAR